MRLSEDVIKLLEIHVSIPDLRIRNTGPESAVACDGQTVQTLCNYNTFQVAYHAHVVVHYLDLILVGEFAIWDRWYRFTAGNAQN